MNKLTKGAIAGGAGIILLMGGAGTFALWNDSATVDGGEIQSGTLTLTANGAGQWRDASPDVNSGVPVNINPATFLTVPGDVLTYTQSVTVGATGTNLLAEFDYEYTAPVDLPDGITASVAVTRGVTTITGPVTVANNDVFTVVLTLEFDVDTPGLVSQAETVDLDAFDVTVTQVRPLP